MKKDLTTSAVANRCPAIRHEPCDEFAAGGEPNFDARFMVMTERTQPKNAIEIRAYYACQTGAAGQFDLNNLIEPPVWPFGSATPPAQLGIQNGWRV